MSDQYLALKVVMMPKDSNPVPSVGGPGNVPLNSYSTIFGGVVLSYIDQAGAIGARHAVVCAGGALPLLVTVAFNRVEFHQPVLVGDVVSFWTRLGRMGRTSITMQVTVEAERGGDKLHVTEAEVVYVNIDRTERKPSPILPVA